jgi:hypothetical protein
MDKPLQTLQCMLDPLPQRPACSTAHSLMSAERKVCWKHFLIKTFMSETHAVVQQQQQQQQRRLRFAFISRAEHKKGAHCSDMPSAAIPEATAIVASLSTKAERAAPGLCKSFTVTPAAD